MSELESVPIDYSGLIQPALERLTTQALRPVAFLLRIRCTPSLSPGRLAENRFAVRRNNLAMSHHARPEVLGQRLPFHRLALEI